MICSWKMWENSNYITTSSWYLIMEHLAILTCSNKKVLQFWTRSCNKFRLCRNKRAHTGTHKHFHWSWLAPPIPVSHTPSTTHKLFVVGCLFVYESSVCCLHCTVKTNTVSVPSAASCTGTKIRRDEKRNQSAAVVGTSWSVPACMITLCSAVCFQLSESAQKRAQTALNGCRVRTIWACNWWVEKSDVHFEHPNYLLQRLLYWLWGWRGVILVLRIPGCLHISMNSWSSKFLPWSECSSVGTPKQLNIPSISTSQTVATCWSGTATASGQRCPRGKQGKVPRMSTAKRQFVTFTCLIKAGEVW